MTEVKNQTHCPTDDELMQYKLGNSDEENFRTVTEHLVACSVCPRTILDFLPETADEWELLKTYGEETSEGDDQAVDEFWSADLTDEFERMRQDAIRLEEKRKDFNEIGLQGLRAGQVWRPKADNILLPTTQENKYVSEFDLDSKNRFVVIKDSELKRVGRFYVIRVVPVDDNLSRAAEDDVIIPANSNPLERDLVLQVWNEKEMLTENLEGYFGDVAEEWVSAGQREYNITSENSSDGIEKLFSAFRKKIGDFAYVIENIVPTGQIANPVYRYRTKAVAESNYLSFPVESLRYAESQKEVIEVAPTSPTFLEQIKSIFSMSPSPTFVSAANKPQSLWEKDEKTYFDGRLRCKRRKSVEGHNLLLLQSDDAEFANRFVLLGENEADLTLAFLTVNNPLHQGYVSVLNFGEVKSPEKGFSAKILDASELSKLDENLIQNSIARVDEATELSAWKELADTAEIDENLSKIIRQAVKEKEPKSVD